LSEANPRSRTCVVCGSKGMVRADQLEGGSVLGGGLRVALKVTVRGRKKQLKASGVVADVCLDCGCIQLGAGDLAALREAVARQPHSAKKK
jgi:hypothetical protein